MTPHTPIVALALAGLIGWCSDLTSSVAKAQDETPPTQWGQILSKLDCDDFCPARFMRYALGTGSVQTVWGQTWACPGNPPTGFRGPRFYITERGVNRFTKAIVGGECFDFRVGDHVRLDMETFDSACVAPLRDQRPCQWIAREKLFKELVEHTEMERRENGNPPK
jgi:hypothetical protein